MRHKVYFISFLCITALIISSLAGCLRISPATSTSTSTTATADTTSSSETTANPTTTLSTSSSSTEATSATPVWSVKSTEKSYMANDGKVVLTASCKLPVISNANAVASGSAINKYFDGLAAATMKEAEELAPQAIDAYKSLGSDFYPWNEDQSGEIVWQTEKFVSTTALLYAYTGGAHPNSLLSSACFDLKTGKILKLYDFFKIPTDQVDTLLIKNIYEQAKTTMDESGEMLLYDCTEEAIREAFKSEYFYLTEDALVIYFQPYDIAPYAAGLPQFKITYDELKDVWEF